MDNIKYRIAILDEEENERDEFCNYFEHQFDGETEFECIDLTDVTIPEELIEKIRIEKIDAVAIDYKLKDHGSLFKYNGDSFFKELQNNLDEYPTFIITNDPKSAKIESSKINPFYILDKERIDLTKARLKLDVITIIKNYKDQLQEDFIKLKRLEDIRVNLKLSPSQEDEYVELNNNLDKKIDQKSHISRTFYSNDTNKKLDDIISKTDKLLEKISKQ